MKRWYVVQTHPQGETKALVNLERQGFDAYLPRYRKWRSHARRRELVLAPLFPRYLFVGIDLAEQGWRAIQSSFGVSHLVCNSGMPAAVPDNVVERIKAREDETHAVRLDHVRLFAKGERVRIMDGAFRDQLGLFDSANDQERVTILLKLLGRDLRVRVPLEAVAAYS